MKTTVIGVICVIVLLAGESGVYAYKNPDPTGVSVYENTFSYNDNITWQDEQTYVWYSSIQYSVYDPGSRQITTTPIATNALQGASQTANYGGKVYYVSPDADSGTNSVYYWDSSTEQTQQVPGSGSWNQIRGVSASNGVVAWSDWDPSFKYYDGNTVHEVVDTNYSWQLSSGPSIWSDGGTVVQAAFYDQLSYSIYYWDTTMGYDTALCIAQGDPYGSFYYAPKVYDGKVVMAGQLYDPELGYNSDYDIFTWDSTNGLQRYAGSAVGLDDEYPDINGDTIAWQQYDDYNIWMGNYDGTNVRQITFTDDMNETNPSVWGGQVAWLANNGVGTVGSTFGQEGEGGGGEVPEPSTLLLLLPLAAAAGLIRRKRD